MDTKEYLDKLAKASLKHIQVMDSMLLIAPEDAKPGIIATQDTPKAIYEKKRDAMLNQGLTPPQNPFNGT